LRATPPDRKAASAPSREDESFAGKTPDRDAAAVREAADAAVTERNETQRRLAERAAARDTETQRAANEIADASKREAEAPRAETVKNEAAQGASSAASSSKPAEQPGAQETGAQENDAAAARAEAAEASKSDVKAPPEPRPEDIKKLEQIRAEALYPSPPSAQSREIAQRAHTELIRAEAELKAYELEKSIQKAREQAIARFNADQAAEAYRQFEEFDMKAAGRLH
jgi:hypothetical protein